MRTLFDPIRFGRLSSRNRIVMAPLTRIRATSANTDRARWCCITNSARAQVSSSRKLLRLRPKPRAISIRLGFIAPRNWRVGELSPQRCMLKGAQSSRNYGTLGESPMCHSSRTVRHPYRAPRDAQTRRYSRRTGLRANRTACPAARGVARNRRAVPTGGAQCHRRGIRRGGSPRRQWVSGGAVSWRTVSTIARMHTAVPRRIESVCPWRS